MSEYLKRDFKANKKHFIKMMIFITLFVVLGLMLFSYVKVVDKSLDKADAVNLTANSVTLNLNKADYNNSDVVSKLDKVKNVGEVHMWSSNILSGSLSLNVGSDKKSLLCVDVNYMDSIPKAYDKELQGKDLGNTFKFGKMSTSADEIVVSCDLAEMISTNAEQAVGKVVSLTQSQVTIDNPTGGTKNIFENKTIVGVLNDKISELEIYGGEFLPTIIMTNACVPAETGSQNFLFCSVYLDSYFNRDSAISEINQIFSSEEMSVLSTSSDTMVAIESQKKIMLAVLTTACALIIIALFLSYIIELLGNAKKQEGRFNVMFSCGITQKKLWLIVFVEELIVSVVSLILAFGLSAALLTVIYKIVESTSGVALATNFGILLPMLGIATGGIVVLSILTSLIPLLVFRKKW